MSPESAAGRPAGPAVIRKYANRRLYNTASGQFVTLADLHDMIRRGEDFVVREAKTDRDLTAWVLAQIVAEEAGKGNELLSLGYLRRLLRFYHEGLGDHLSAYLESSMELFAANQRDLLRHLSGPFDPVGALATFRELGERNADHFTRLFRPATGGSGRDPAAASEAGEPAPPSRGGKGRPGGRRHGRSARGRPRAPRRTTSGPCGRSFIDRPAPPRRPRAPARKTDGEAPAPFGRRSRDAGQVAAGPVSLPRGRKRTGTRGGRRRSSRALPRGCPGGPATTRAAPRRARRPPAARSSRGRAPNPAGREAG